MRKYTNILLLSTFLFIVGLMLLGAAKLNSMLAHTDLNDPYRDFNKIELPAFRWVSFEMGGATQPGEWKGYRYSHSARIEPGAERLLYIHKNIADSVRHIIRHDTLYVRGANPGFIVYLGAVLKCPALNGVSASFGELQLNGGRYDSLQVYVGRYAEANLLRADFGALLLTADSSSSIRLDTGTVVNRLRLNLGPKSTFSTRDALPAQFEWTADESAKMTFTGKSQQLLRK